jgi:uncharacterized membrane protein SpoIIM required for sporulation/uncharacterized RDD family membrane protein YckC
MHRPPRAHAPAVVLADRQVEVETPEHVAIAYELADLGSRFTALLIDFSIIVGGVTGAALLFAIINALVPIPGVLTGLGAAVAMVFMFCVFWGYFFYFEAFREGQTPGKRWMGIRVVEDGGYPATARASAVRNLLRFVDLQPIPTCIVGGLAMMLHGKTKRLGDMAAGTVVVREKGGAALPEEAERGAELGPPRLTDDEFAWLARYVARRDSLDPEVRARLSREPAAAFAPRFADDPRQRVTSPDGFLVMVHTDEASRRSAAGRANASGSPQAAALLRRQRPVWNAYQTLLDRARREGLAALPEREVSRFAGLYREVAADLARARTYGGSPALLYLLERSVGAGHNLLYRPPRRSLKKVAAWARAGFPALVRRRWKPILLAAALFYGPAAISFAVVANDPEVGYELLPATIIARAEEAAAKEKRGEGYVEIREAMMPQMAGGITTNNVQVTFITFAGGILAGLGTLLLLVSNGIHLGSAAGFFAAHGQSVHLWTFVVSHGALELTAICIAGGAGLWLGSGMILPGRLTRGQALVERGREAVSLIAGTTMMLILAGTIEGFVSPSALPRELKFAFAAVIAVLMVLYLAFAGRGRAPEESDAA